MFKIDSKTTLGIRLAALILSIIWSAFWIFFVFATLSSDPFSAQEMLITFIFFLFFSAITFFSWKYPRRGGIATIAVGLIVLIGYPIIICPNFPPATIVFVLIFMGLPPVLSGLLNLLFWKRLKAECPDSSIENRRIQE